MANISLLRIEPQWFMLLFWDNRCSFKFRDSASITNINHLHFILPSETSYFIYGGNFSRLMEWMPVGVWEASWVMSGAVDYKAIMAWEHGTPMARSATNFSTLCLLWPLTPKAQRQMTRPSSSSVPLSFGTDTWHTWIFYRFLRSHPRSRSFDNQFMSQPICKHVYSIYTVRHKQHTNIVFVKIVHKTY